ncbi:hypothetical protein FFI89_028920 [Bradyrhizobium sp. KBS0727]|nr:hypothetical protein FFI71_028925 [Bradyrhizobium sp. KBS0725]QDW47401.1 hypothetical protein FFI89_028920 [Bradyrhizobium sp. KBS0727]
MRPNIPRLLSPSSTLSNAPLARDARARNEEFYHRDHLPALAQRIEVADREVRIMGLKSVPPRIPVAASIANRQLPVFAVPY